MLVSLRSLTVALGVAASLALAPSCASKSGGKHGSPGEIDAVLFNPGEGGVEEFETDNIDKAAEMMRDDPGLHVLLIGRTDSFGGAQSNLRLGMERARQVRESLLATGDGAIEPERVHIGSRGQADPVGSNQTNEGRAQNRRVEFFLFYPDNRDLKSRLGYRIVLEGED